MFPLRHLLLQHGYALVFSYVLCVQAGLPIPADPLLLVMGAMVGDKQYSFVTAALLGTMGALIGDWTWYELGRLRGRSILSLLCKLSLEPDTCVRKTEATFLRRGPWTLLFAKFVPGMSLISTPLAGMIRMSRARFLVYDAGGALLWISSYLAVGAILHRQVDFVIEALTSFGRWAGVIIVILIALYLGWKYFQRWRFLRQLRINRVTPEALYQMLQTGKDVTIVDLRHPGEIEREGFKIAGAFLVTPNELRERTHSVPAKGEIVLYCSCPNEVTSARVAMQLREAGIRHVRPLAGGVEAGHSLGYPVEPVLTANSGAEHTSPDPVQS